nr:PAC2 family protein [Propionibacterium sp.]
MLDPRSLYTFSPEAWASVQGRGAVLLHLLEGYVDAGGVSRVLSEQILDNCAHTTVVEFDVDQLHDYRARRPAMTFDSSRWVGATMPALAIHRVTDRAGVDFLLLSGPEPDSQWGRAIEAILTVAQGLGVGQLVTASGVPMGVPHSRPLLVTTHGTSDDLVSANPVFIDRVTVPGSFSALLELRAGEQGLAARGFVVHVPHYLAQGTFVPAALRAAELIGDAVGLDLPLDDLADTAEATMEALRGEVEGDPELGELVASLERGYDELQAKGNAVPTMEEISRAVERFLAEQDEGRGDA